MRIPVGILLLATVALGSAAFAQIGERTTQDRVFSDEQASRGKIAYDAQCSNCHDGGGMGPALTGDDFLAAWQNKTMRALYNRILTTMPSDAPGTLPDSEALDIVAFMMRSNGFPSGDKALATPDELNDVKIARAK
jgi:mono/diheme cytochrome c family protein